MKFYRILFLNCFFIFYIKSNLIDKRNKYCDDQYIGELQQNIHYFKDRRNFTRNYFLDKYEDIITYWKNRDSQALFKAFMPFGILSIIYILILFLVLLIFIFCCIKKGQKDADKSKKCIYCVYIILIFIIILFVLATILIIVSSGYLKGIYCSIFEISGSILYGSEEESSFIGVLTYQNLIVNFYQDLQNIANNSQDFQNIINQNYIAKSNESISSLHDFYQNNILKKTSNGTNTLQTPISILSQKELLNNIAESEFNKLAEVSYILTRAAYAGINYSPTQSAEYAYNIAAKIQSIGTQQEDIGIKLANDTQSMFDLSTACSYLALAFLIAIIIVIFIIACRGFKKKEQYRRNMLCLIIYQILSILFLILIFLMFIGLTSIWSSCGLIRELNTGDVTFFEKNNFDINQYVNTMFKSCYDEKDPNTIVDVVTYNDSFQQQQFFRNINNILLGIDNYIKFSNQQEIKYDKGITNQIEYYNKHESGLIMDHYKARGQLILLNNAVQCDNKYFVFNKNNCDQQSDCQIIDGTTQYQIPTCANSQNQPETILSNLNSYRNAQKANADDLINRLSEKQNSPKNLHISLLNDLQSIKPSINVLFDRFTRTKQYMQEQDIKIPLKQLLSCKSIKLPSLKYERKVCFKYNLYMYVAMIILFIISLLLFFLSFCLCTEIRTVNYCQKQNDKPTEIKKKNGNVSFEIQTDLSNIMEDNEKVPMF